mmetsp:Transcript_14470/g.38129  ORF Transcript_14470/g.38129 Transcript_14470/m.38129 type:complete len:202 (-) Transcript_14470:64-669(-)
MSSLAGCVRLLQRAGGAVCRGWVGLCSGPGLGGQLAMGVVRPGCLSRLRPGSQGQGSPPGGLKASGAGPHGKANCLNLSKGAPSYCGPSKGAPSYRLLTAALKPSLYQNTKALRLATHAPRADRTAGRCGLRCSDIQTPAPGRPAPLGPPHTPRVRRAHPPLLRDVGKTQGRWRGVWITTHEGAGLERPHAPSSRQCNVAT